MNLAKRLVSSRFLAKIDGLIQPTGRWWQLTPSVFIKTQAGHTYPAAEGNSFFLCPECRSSELATEPHALICQTCRRKWSIHDGLYDFKEPL